MKKNKSGLKFNKRLIIKTVILIITLSTGLYFYQRLKKSDYFRIRQIITRYGNNEVPDNTCDFSDLRGKNIFELNLSREASNIQGSYPNYKKIRLIRFPPDILIVDFIKRKPLACIKSTRFFYIDESLTLFQYLDTTEGLDLPQITGLDRKIFAAKYGSRFYISEVVLALDIIKKVKSNRQLKDCKIKRVDVSTLSSASIFVLVPNGLLDYTKGQLPDRGEDLEVRIGQEDIGNKIKILATLFTQVRNNLNNIKYIDLRFKEPVIKLK